MYASRLVLALLALSVAIVMAQPHGRYGNYHKHRSIHPPQPSQSCSRRSTPSTVSAIAEPSALNGVAAINNGGATFPPSPSASASSSNSPAPSASTSSNGNSTNNGGAANALFPVTGFKQSWSTSSLAANTVPLNDATLRPTRVLSALSHDYVDGPDGKRAMKAHFPKGSYTFGHQPQGGLSFYAPGPENVDLSTAKEATFGYSVFFEDGFAFNRGGKLPGIYGGNSDEEALSCSGGRRSSACFSARLMWRAEGAGEFYTYLPPYTESRYAANGKQCDIAPYSECNPTYGASVGRGAFSFKAGQWNTISERVRLNDVGQANGELELFVDGKSVIKVDGLILRDSDVGRMRGIQMQTFFGGSSKKFASPRDQDLYFADFSVAITESL